MPDNAYRDDNRDMTGISAVILAAGYSSRMGELKPALMIWEDTVIDLTVGNFISAGIRDIVVVTGYRAEDVRTALYFKDAVRFAHNSGFDKGMFTSVKTGVGALPGECRAFLLVPADCAGFKPSTVTALVAEYNRAGADVVYPEYDSRRRGHPVLISASLISEILAEPDDSNLRDVLSRHGENAIQTAVEDIGVTMDMDTPQEYEKMRGFIGRRWDRDIALAYAMQKISSTTALCSAVITAELAFRAAKAVQSAHLYLDAELVYSAALLYRAEETPEKTADYLYSINLPKLGRIAGKRAEPAALAEDPMSEAALVFLADQAVRDLDASPEAQEIKRVADAVAGRDVFAEEPGKAHDHHHTHRSGHNG